MIVYQGLTSNNIVGGIELVKKCANAQVHGLTVPLLTTSKGEKLGKTSTNAVWLNPEKTSDFAMYQYLVGLPDLDQETLFYMLTDLDIDTVQELVAQGKTQKRLAKEVVEKFRGKQSAQAAEEASNVLFYKDQTRLSAPALHALKRDLDVVHLDEVSSLADVLLHAGLCGSKAEVKRAVVARSVKVGGEVVDDVDAVLKQPLGVEDIQLVSLGKKKHVLVVK